jgi:hypothetical protein
MDDVPDNPAHVYVIHLDSDAYGYSFGYGFGYGFGHRDSRADGHHANHGAIKHVRKRMLIGLLPVPGRDPRQHPVARCTP